MSYSIQAIIAKQGIFAKGLYRIYVPRLALTGQLHISKQSSSVEVACKLTY